MHPFAVAAASLLAGLLLISGPAAAQGWGTVEGRVTQAVSDEPLPGASVLVEGTDYGTATGAEGRFRLRLPTGTYVLRISAVGFRPHADTVVVRRDEVTQIEVALRDAVFEMDELTVEDRQAYPEAGVHEIDPADVENMPMPMPDGLRALKVMPGVAASNELSSQYSVRGGGYNENLIFINGFEVYLPFRPRQGEQEGLSLFNPALAQGITFYTGGFPARYGGKLASALDVRYRRPEGEALSGATSLSLMDASVTAGASAMDGRLGWVLGARRAQPQRLFGSQELKGDYDPRFSDLQAHLAYRLAPGHELEALGIWAEHRFRLEPSQRRTYFGILSLDPDVPSDLQSHYTHFEGEEVDGYETRVAGLRLKTRLSDRFRMEHDAALFQTEETELVDITGTSELAQVDPSSGEVVARLGRGVQQDSVNNRIRVRTLTGRGRYMLMFDRHAFEAGWLARGHTFENRIEEHALHRNLVTGELTVIDGLSDEAELRTHQLGAYLQDAVDVLPERGRLLLTAGLRTNYYAFNEEWTLSPRLSARFRLSDQTTLTGSLGIYHQQPTYRELRGKPSPGESILGALNHDLNSQRSLQFVLGGEHFLPERRLYIRAEAFYKHLTELISYDIENVRVLYSGENDARGFTYGLDVQLRGELVPGLESWFNYSYLVSRERFLPEYRGENGFRDGLIPRPADQRHTFSAFIQDYVPGDETWKLHLRALFGSGFPYTPPVPGEEISNVVQLQQPGPRAAGRMPEYQRVDIGATKVLPVTDRLIDNPVTLELTAELLNLFDMNNTVAYQWDGAFNRIPVRLTPRMVNVRMRLAF